MTYIDSLRTHQRKAAFVVNHLFEAIAMRDWDDVQDLCAELKAVAAAMEEDNHSLLIGKYCAPRAEGT